jgi:hypothetical protein
VSEGVPLRDPLAFRGRVETRPFESEVLKGNPLGDPHLRELPVYLPPGFDARGARFPVVFVLAGFTGRGQKYLETHPWRQGFVQAYDRAIARGEAPRAILVLPDCFTRLGGSQYVNSSAVGRYEDHVAHELVDFVDACYPTLPGRRGLLGKSSGGFGAMHLSLRHPGRFPAVASVAGDCHFGISYASEFLSAARGLLAHDSDPARFLEAFFERPVLTGDAHAVLNLLAMSACYSPNPASPLGFDLPIELERGERIPEVWERWLAFDPLHAVELHPESWRQLELLHLEAGVRDEFHLQFALRSLVRKLRELDIACEHEEFPGGHFDTDERFLRILPRLVSVLEGNGP